MTASPPRRRLPGRAARSLAASRGRRFTTASCAWLIGLIASCAEPGRGTDYPEFEGGVRQVRGAAFEALWTAGGDPADTLLLLPVAIAARDGVVYLLDRYGNRVIAFDGATGAHLWSRGRRGRGPGELDAPNALALTADGEVGVGDARNGRIARFRADGVALAPAPVRNVAYIESLCALDGGDWLLTTLTEGTRVLRVASHGARVGSYPLPGPYPDDAPALATQAVLLGGAGEPCVLAFRSGAGFAVFRTDGWEGFRTFVEPVAPPEVVVRTEGRRTAARAVEPRTAAIDGAVVGDELWVLFGGETDDARRLVDRYAMPAGTYLGSWRLPVAASGIAVDDARMYLLSSRDGYPAAVALPRPDLSSR